MAKMIMNIWIMLLNKAEFSLASIGGDFYRLHVEYVERNIDHAGIALANQQQYSIGEQMRRILRLAASKTEEDMRNWVEFLSAWG